MNTRVNDPQAETAARKCLCSFLEKPDRDYAEIGNRTPSLPHGDVSAAWDDIAQAVRYLIGQGHNIDDLKLVLRTIVNQETDNAGFQATWES